MAVQQTTRTRLVHTLTLAAALLAGFLVASWHLTRESLWEDEGYTLGFVRDSGRPPETLGEILQFVRTSLTSTLSHVRAVDVHPPLYYLALDGWTLITGDSIYVVRLFSTLWAVLALAATYAVGKVLFDDHWLALIAVLVLATASFFVYYAREARMYTLLTALTTLSMLAYIHWQQRPTFRSALLYALVMAALLYTHYASVFVILTQVFHTLIRGKRSIRVVIPFLGAALLFAPWIPSALAQWRLQGGPGALPLPSDWGTVAALLLIVTSGYGWLYGLLALLALTRRNGCVLLLLWLIVLPLALLVLNAAVRPLFQIRYILPVLPAFALLIAAGLGQLFAWRPFKAFPPLRVAGVTVLLLIPLSTYAQFWPGKPLWDEAVLQMTATRQPLEPAITGISPYSPAAYYDRLYGIRRGISLDVGWRWQESYEMQAYLDHLKESPSIWLVLPSNVVSTWDVVSGLLARGYGVGYRDSVMNMAFYRFDRSDADALRWRFGDAAAWEGGIGHHLYAEAGEPFCFDLRLRALQPLDSQYRVDLALTQGYNTRRSELIVPLSTADPEQSVCMDIPADIPAGPHHLRVRVLYNGVPLPLIEDEDNYWSEDLVIALVSVA